MSERIDLEAPVAEGAGCHAGADTMREAAAKAGKQTGILLFNPDDYARYHGQGMRMIACGADGTFVAQGAKGMAEKLHARRSES